MSVHTSPSDIPVEPGSPQASLAPHTEPPILSEQELDTKSRNTSQTKLPAKSPPKLASPDARDGGRSAEQRPEHKPLAFKFPSLYYFPPFFTIQTNLTTRVSQLDSWMALVLGYCTYYRIFRISTFSELFHYERLRRRLAPDDVRILFSYLAERGRAEWVGSESSSSKSRSKESGSSRDEVWVWWKTPEEWANDIQTWIDETGQRNAILTFYELLEGDATVSQEFHGIPRELLQSSLKVLTKRGKAAVFGEEDQLGVKFY